MKFVLLLFGGLQKRRSLGDFFAPWLVGELGVVEPDSGCGYSFIRAVIIDGKATPPKRPFIMETGVEEVIAGEAFVSIVTVRKVSNPSVSCSRVPVPVVSPAGGLSRCSSRLAVDGCCSSGVDDSRGHWSYRP